MSLSPSNRHAPLKNGSQDESTLKSVTSPVTSCNTMQIRRSRCGNHTQETTPQGCIHRIRQFVIWADRPPSRPLPFSLSPLPRTPSTCTPSGPDTCPRAASVLLHGADPACNSGIPSTYSPALRGIRRSNALHHAGVVVPISPEPLRPCCSFAMPFASWCRLVCEVLKQRTGLGLCLR